MKKYDVIILGSGSGLVVLEEAIAHGKKCAIVEKSKFGGTCLTRGCIPSKMLVYPADLIREAETASRIGLEFSPPRLDFKRVGERMWRQINVSSRIEANLKRQPGLDVYNGTAEFTGPRSIVVKTDDGGVSDELTADIIVVAVGARSFIPPISGLEAAGYITYESFFGPAFPDEPWDSLIIVGGGAIGAEFAHIFSAFGTKVTIVEMKDHIVPTEDEEVSSFVERQFEKVGIDVLTGVRAVSAGLNDMGKKTLKVEKMKTGETVTLEASEIFIASGVRPNTDILHLDHAGVKTDPRGFIITDEHLRTSQPGIYAIGDVNGKYLFRHVANYEASVLCENLFYGGNRRASYDAVPWAIFTHPQVGHVGLTEREARERGLSIGIARNKYSEIASGIAMGYKSGAPDDGFAKIILDRNMRVLGAHVVGPNAAILVQPFVFMMNSGIPCNELKSACLASGGDVESCSRLLSLCPEAGTVRPALESMVIHPSMNELTVWALDSVEWDN